MLVPFSLVTLCIINVQGKPIILPNDIEAIFGNLEAIYAYHLQLVSKLEARISKWNVDTQIGDTFLDMVPLSLSSGMIKELRHSSPSPLCTCARMRAERGLHPAV